MKFPSGIRAFITGGGSGLGRELAIQLAQEHQARILIADVNPDTARQTAQIVAECGGIAEHRICDVTQSDDLLAAAKQMDELWGGTDLLINNAGISAAGTIGDFSLEDWHWAINVNLWGVINGCHHFAPTMRARGSGWILNVASNAAITSLPEMGPYNVSKAGVVSLSETLRAELKPHGIRVSVLCPTFFPSNLMDSFRSSDERQRKMAQAMFRRAGITTKRVAEIALRDAQRNRLMIIPQRDGKLTWWAKRLMPETMYNIMGREYRRRVLQHPAMNARDSISK